MAEYKYYKDLIGLDRVNGDKVQHLNSQTHEWTDFDYKKFYTAIGDYKWAQDYMTLTPEQARQFVKDEYGLDEIPE